MTERQSCTTGIVVLALLLSYAAVHQRSIILAAWNNLPVLIESLRVGETSLADFGRALTCFLP